MSNDLECPVDFVTVNENKVRLVAFFVALLALLCWVTSAWIIAAVLLSDFLLRAFNFNNYSPLSLLSGEVTKWFRLKNKPVDRAPKRFAAFIGLGFSAAILLALLLGWIVLSKLLTLVLIVFALLESLAGFCAGCYVYSWLKRFKMIK